MPIPWLSVLKAVPWSEVIGNAPKIAGGARKLWESVGRTKDQSIPPSGSVQPDSGNAPDTRLAILTAEIEQLRQQLHASSELIASLAEQNAQLIARMDQQRRRLKLLAVFVAALAVLISIALFTIASG